MNTSSQINVKPPKSDTVHFTHKDHILVFSIVITSFIIHSMFIIDGFGKVDSANFAVTAIEWNQIGKPIFISTLFRTSILYLQYLKTFLSSGFPSEHLDSLMNWTNVVIGSITCIPLYYFWRRFASSSTVIIYLVMLFLAPAFWLGNIYGFPHIPALFFFLLSLIFYDLFLTKNSKVHFFYLILSFLCATFAVGLKADIILCFGAFGGLVFFRRQWSLIALSSVCVIPVLAFIIIVTYSRLLFPIPSSTSQFAREWFRYFPFSIHAFMDPTNLAATVTPVGIIFSISTLLAIIYGVFKKKHFKILVFIFTWAMPIGLFWSTRMGNSARHMISAWLPLLFYTALILKESFPVLHKRFSFLALLLFANYFLCPSSQLPRTVRPSSRIFCAKDSIQRYVSQWHQLGKTFADFDASKKMIAGGDLIRYVCWEMLKNAYDFSYDFTTNIYTINDANHNKLEFKQMHVSRKDLDLIQTDYPDWTILYLKSDNENTTFDFVNLEQLNK